MGPLHFTTAKGSRAGCGHLLGGALRQEWVARLSRGDGWQSRVHGVTGERDGENQVGGFRGHLCSSSSQSWLSLPSRNISRLHQIEIKDYNSQYAPQLLCMYLGSCSSLEKPCALSSFPQSLADGVAKAEQRT